jgi:hypothetical protein
MGTGRTRLPLLAGLLFSLLTHAAALLPLLVATMTPQPRPALGAAVLRPEDFREPASEPDSPRPEVRLGIEAPTPSTLTWVGYEEYQAHVTAVQAEMDQAAFTEAPGGGPPAASPGPPQRPEPPITASEPLDYALHAAGPKAAAPDQPDRPTAWPEAPDGPSPAPDSPKEEPLDLLAALNRMIEQAAAQRERPEPRDAGAAGSSSAEPSPDAHAAGPPAPATPPAAGTPVTASNPTPGSTAAPPEPGDRSDKESDAASVVTVSFEDVRMGRPLAGHGLELLPARPVFTPLLRLTALPGNPLVEMRFARDGRPRSAAILRSSGDARVDEAMLSSLYRWRARGGPLADLGDAEMIDVRLRIILNTRAP